MPAQIIVTAPAGSTVTATHGVTVLTATEDSGTWVFNVTEYGDWVIAASKSGVSDSETISVTKAKQYTVEIVLNLVDSVLNNNSWETISAVSEAGTAANYWSVGDRKELTLNGTVGQVTFTDYSVVAFILGFDHNSSYEGTKRIHFQVGKSALTGGVDIAFVDSSNGNSVNSNGRFSMKSSASNSGGWNGSQMRTVICGTALDSSNTFIAALPSSLRSVLKTVSKYTNNTGQSSQSSAVTETTDYCFLLAEWEVFGSRTYASTYERTRQAQYSYYSAGNSKIKNRHNSQGTANLWWLRSPYASGNSRYCVVGTSGSVSYRSANYSLGFAPCFCV